MTCPNELAFNMGSNHSEAYAEILNLINIANHHREHCTEECAVSLHLLKMTAMQRLKHTFNHEKQDAILKITETNWN